MQKRTAVNKEYDHAFAFCLQQKMSQIQMAAYRHIFRRYRQYEYSAEIACIGYLR